MTKACEVTKVLWAGRKGGAVLHVLAENKPFRVVADASVMPREPVPGETWAIDGWIRVHPAYGRQVEARRATLSRPSGRMILGFLKGPACPGIGETKATALWDALGEEIYDALADPADTRISKIVGEDLARIAQSAWEAHEADVVAWRWCEAQGLPVRLSRRLSAIYGQELPERMAENPYRVLAFTNWKTAERLARTVSVPRDDPRRLVGAVESILFDRLDKGHTAISRTDLATAVGQRLEAPSAMAELSIDSAIAEGAVVDHGDLLAGAGAATTERFVATDLARRQGVGRSRPDFLTGAETAALEDLLEDFEAGEALTLNAEQRDAAIMAATSAVSILTGGAGTGKTTALKAIHHLAEAYGVPVFQAALAGRAARRMTEATGKPARTLMALEIALKDGLPLEHGLVIIDEASMLDLPATYRLLRALPPTTRLLLVGDTGQLPPIGFGLILHALVENVEFPKNELREVHRQAVTTGIPPAALAVRNGVLPEFSPYEGSSTGVCFLPCHPCEFEARLLELKEEIPDAQIISALREGPSGTSTINRIFHEALTHGKPQLEGFCRHEPVIWTVNDYTLGLMNGTLGSVLDICDAGLLIDFEGEKKTIAHRDLEALNHAYAITVHKAQGSQFSRVIMPFMESKISDRTLIYTSVTRAKSQVILMGNKGALQGATERPPAPQMRSVLLGSPTFPEAKGNAD
jgi:exodeoxyribonuclease V alpha subunit